MLPKQYVPKMIRSITCVNEQRVCDQLQLKSPVQRVRFAIKQLDTFVRLSGVRITDTVVSTHRTWQILSHKATRIPCRREEASSSAVFFYFRQQIISNPESDPVSSESILVTKTNRQNRTDQFAILWDHSCLSLDFPLRRSYSDAN